MKSSGMMERFCRLTGDSKSLEGEEGRLTDRGGGSMKVSRSLGDPMKLEGEEGRLNDRGGGSMKVSRSLGDPMKKLEGEEGRLTDRGGGSMKVSRSLGDSMKKLWLRQQIVFFPRWVHMFTNPIQVQNPADLRPKMRKSGPNVQKSAQILPR
jgi:hypothetical protein